MPLDYGLLNLALTIALLAATFLFRKRLFHALGTAIVKSFLSKGPTALVDAIAPEQVSQASDGTETRVRALSGPARAIVAATVPVLVAEALKTIKLKPGAPASLPEGLDLSNLSSALPALLGSGMIPKKYAGLLALAAPFLQGFLGPGAAGPKAEAGMSEITRKLIP